MRTDNRMSFTTLVELPVGGIDDEAVMIKMHVAEQPRRALLPATNALKELGHVLVCRPR